MTASSEEQVQYLINELNRQPDMDYQTFVTGMLGTHWDAQAQTNVLTYVHANRIIPQLPNSSRALFQDHFRRFYRLEGVLAKMATIQNTLDVLDLLPMPSEPDEPTDYALMEVVLARIAGKPIIGFSSKLEYSN